MPVPWGACTPFIWSHGSEWNLWLVFTLSIYSASVDAAAVFLSGCTSLYFYHQGLNIPAAPRPSQACYCHFSLWLYLLWCTWLSLLLLYQIMSYWFVKLFTYFWYQSFGYMGCRHFVAFYPLNGIFWWTRVLNFKTDSSAFSFAVSTCCILLKTSFPIARKQKKYTFIII